MNMELLDHHLVRLAHAHRAVYDGRYSFPRHIHTFHQLYCVMEGSVLQTVEGTTHRVNSGEILWIAPGLQRAPKSHGQSGSYFVVVFDAPWKDLGVGHGRKFRLDAIGKYFARNFDELIPTGSGSAALQIAFYSLVMHLAGKDRFLKIKSTSVPHASDCLSSSLSLLVRAENIMKANVGNRLRLEDIAFMAGASHATLDRCFKKHRKTSSYARFCSIRLEEVKALIRQGGKTMTAIAHETGFSSSQHMATAFRQHFKLSPSQYKNVA